MKLLAVLIGFLPLIASGKVVEISSHNTHTCARFDDGNVKCWGGNFWGQLGFNGEPFAGDPSKSNFVPLDGKKAVSLGAGWSSNCAIVEEGELKCWGRKESLFEGLPKDFRAIQVSSGWCVLGDNGKVYSTNELRLRTVEGMDGASQIAAGNVTVCGLVNGQVFCTSGDKTHRLAQDKKAVQISAKAFKMCALMEDATVACSDYVQLEGRWDPLRTVDLNVGDLDATAISCGADHCCVTFFNGSAKCWGERNDRGQLGFVGKNIDTFLDLPARASVKQISAGVCQTCALLDNDTVHCFGCGGGERGKPVEIKF